MTLIYQIQELQTEEIDGYLEIILSLQRDAEEELFNAGVLGRSSPKALLNHVLLNNLKSFCKKHLCRGVSRLILVSPRHKRRSTFRVCRVASTQSQLDGALYGTNACIDN